MQYNIREIVSALVGELSKLSLDNKVEEINFAREAINEESTFKIFSFFTLLSLVISCLGLYGLTALIVERMNKEIGIRKVFGG